mmetsp:Transcript_7733/g.8832  ORF Transcript_7733/g.8832 Transcript_7733/m.8832 type:complete len:217 (+) Transcript_7733:1121-1771(+)
MKPPKHSRIKEMKEKLSIRVNNELEDKKRHKRAKNRAEKRDKKEDKRVSEDIQNTYKKGVTKHQIVKDAKEESERNFEHPGDGMTYSTEECTTENLFEINFIASDVLIAANQDDMKALSYFLQQTPGLAAHSDENGRTVLHVAVDNEHLEIVDFLLKLPNVDVNAKTNKGSSAIWLARNLEENHPIVISLKQSGGIFLGSQGSTPTTTRHQRECHA